MTEQEKRRIDRQRIIQCGVFLVSGLVLGSGTLSLILMFVWGAPTHPVEFVALFSSLGLIAASLLILFRPKIGRLVAALSLLGIGILWIPAATSLVPTHNTFLDPVAYLYPVIYFFALGFALLYPKPVRFAWPSLLSLVCVVLGINGWIFWQQLQCGEYNYPTIDKFTWQPGGSELAIRHNEFHMHNESHILIDNDTKDLLMKNGIRGTLVWRGSGGSMNNPNRMLLIAQQQPVDSPKLHLPRKGKIIYVYDGKKWMTIPQDAPTYPSFITLELSEMDSHMTMLVNYDWQGNPRMGMTGMFTPSDFKKRAAQIY